MIETFIIDREKIKQRLRELDAPDPIRALRGLPPRGSVRCPICKEDFVLCREHFAACLHHPDGTRVKPEERCTQHVYTTKGMAHADCVEDSK